jgi:predicted nucleic acid-binding Zn finger protein
VLWCYHAIADMEGAYDEAVLSDEFVEMPSFTTEGKTYLVSLCSCSCADFVHRGGSFDGKCKHTLRLESEWKAKRDALFESKHKSLKDKEQIIEHKEQECDEMRLECDEMEIKCNEMRMKCDEMKVRNETAKNELNDATKELNDAKNEQDILSQFALIRRLPKGKCLIVLD